MEQREYVREDMEKRTREVREGGTEYAREGCRNGLGGRKGENGKE